MTWHSPLLLLLCLPVMALGLWVFWHRKHRIPTVQFSYVPLLKQGAIGIRARLSFLPLILQILFLILLVIVLARPQLTDKLLLQSVDGIDIVVALDISDSMLIEDLVPENRPRCSQTNNWKLCKGACFGSYWVGFVFWGILHKSTYDTGLQCFVVEFKGGTA